MSKKKLAELKKKGMQKVAKAVEKTEKVVQEVTKQTKEVAEDMADATSKFLNKTAPRELAKVQDKAEKVVTSGVDYIRDNQERITNGAVGFATGILASVMTGVNRSVVVLSTVAGALGAYIGNKFANRK